MSNTNTKKNIIILSIFFFVLIALLTAYMLLNGRIPANEPGTIGNTAGNLNNHGLFCESDGKVYFANAYDSYTLYSMNPDETDIRKLSNSSIEQLNAGGNYLYYYQTNSASASSFSFISRFGGIYRAKKSGNRAVCLTRDTASLMQLYNDYLYYQHYDPDEGIRLHKLKTDKSSEIVVTESNVNPVSIENGTLYFGGMEEDHSLYTLTLSNDSIQKIWDASLGNPVCYGGFIYYMDIPENYRLCRYDPGSGETQILTEDRIDCFNIYGNYIYYQKNDSEAPALKRIALDGTGEEIIREGNHEKINITSNYVYFNEFGRQVPVYRTPTSGPVNVTTFDTAAKAAENNRK